MTENILTLGMQADDVRRRLFGSRVTYQRVSVIAGDVGPAPIVIPEAASEVRILGWPASADEALALVRRVREAAGARFVSAFSFMDASDMLSQLRDAGANALAEIPVDQIDDVAAAVNAVTAAGLRAERLTMTHAAGHRASELLDKVKRVAENGAIRRFSPLPRVVPIDKPTTGYEDVRLVALARLALPVSIEVDWTLYGPKLAQVALMFGADHLDAVSPTSDPAMGPRRATVEDVERNIRAAGFEPQEHAPA